jgi:hypothetical protein
MVENVTILAAIAIVYGVIATACMLWPERMHAYAIRRNERAKSRNGYGPWLVESPNYALYVQVVGAVSASAAVAITLFLLAQVRRGL